MSWDRFTGFMLHAFALRRRRDYVLKPLMLLLLFTGLFATVARIVLNPSPETWPMLILVAVLVELPFLGLAFMILHMLHDVQRQLADLAMTDALTQLPNRRAFLDAVRRRLKRAEPGLLMILDADHFKRINDTYGHAVGDICLQAIARHIDSLSAVGDIVGRIGGEEFGAFLPEAPSRDLFQIGARMCDSIVVPLADDDPLCLTLSVGATATANAPTIEMLLEQADEALYAAKRAGRARLVTWDAALELSDSAA